MRYQTKAYYRRARRNAAIAELKHNLQPYLVTIKNVLGVLSIFSFIFMLSFL